MARLFVVLPSANQQLIFLDRNIEFCACEARDGERDAQPFRPSVFTRHPLNIVRRVPVGSLRDTIKRPFDFVEAKQKRAR
jgi:hypothetical protein